MNQAIGLVGAGATALLSAGRGMVAAEGGAAPAAAEDAWTMVGEDVS